MAMKPLILFLMIPGTMFSGFAVLHFAFRFIDNKDRHDLWCALAYTVAMVFFFLTLVVGLRPD